MNATGRSVGRRESDEQRFERLYAQHFNRVASYLWRRVPWPVRPLIKRRMLSPEQGAATSLYCVTSAEVAGESGQYYDNLKRCEPSDIATPDLADELWDRSVEWVGFRPSARCESSSAGPAALASPRR